MNPTHKPINKNIKKIIQLPILLAMCLSLQGCLVASAVDLVGTTVLTAGKIAVKGTGSVINAVIPDGDDDDDKKKKEKSEQSEQSEKSDETE